QDLHSFPTRRSSDLWVGLLGLPANLVGTLDQDDARRGFLLPSYDRLVDLGELGRKGACLGVFFLDLLKDGRQSLLRFCLSLGFRSEEHTSELQSREN